MKRSILIMLMAMASNGLSANLYDAEVRFYPGGGTGTMPMQVWTVDFDDWDFYRELPACQFTRPGYVFTGWKVYDGCVYSDKTTPYGGGYAGTYAAGAEYEVCGYLWLEASWRKLGMDACWAKSRTLTGGWGEGCGPSYDGICQLKCGKANKKGIAKVSLKITPFNGKKITYRPVAVNVAAGGPVTVRWGNSYSVTIQPDGSFFGEPIYGDVRPCCSPNAVWNARLGGPVSGRHTLSVDADYDESKDPMVLFESDPYCLNLKLLGPLCWDWEGAGLSFAANGRKWDFGKKPMLKYKLVNGEYQLVGMSADKPNLTGAKISYNPKTGLFKGSFYLYTDPVVCVYRPATTKKTLKLKKYKIAIVGAWDAGAGLGAGVAFSKKPAATWPLWVE